jgi:zinc transporter, ZIP family
MLNSQNIWMALLLTLFAGLSTGIGSVIAFFAKTGGKKFLATSLGFSAGVMIYVSMVEIFSKSKDVLSSVYGYKNGSIICVASFFLGILLIGIIDKLVPSYENPHEIHRGKDLDVAKLKRMGVMTAVAIAIHNFPEGFATFMSAMQDPKLGIAIAVAVAVHNIPEGISVSVPICYATGSKKKAFMYSFMSGLAEPLGAVIGFLLLRPFMNEVLLGITFASVAGIMVFISLDELLPTAREYGEHHLSIYGLIAGMLVMAVSLIMMI